MALGETDPWWAPGTRLAPGSGSSPACGALPAAQASSRHGRGSPEPGVRPAEAASPAAGPDGQQAAARAAHDESPADQPVPRDEQAMRSDGGVDPYPMDYYARDGGVWGSSYHRKTGPQASRGPVRRSVALQV